MEAAAAASDRNAQVAAELALAEPGTVTFDGPAGALPEREREILAFERQWWRYAGAKEQAYDPMLVKRLRRLRSARQRARSARRLGLDG